MALAQTWKSTATGAWDTAANWSTGAAPTGASATAVFGTDTASNGTNISINTVVTVGTLQFNSGAPAYDIAVNSNASLTLAGLGVVDNSANPLTLTVNAQASINFTGTSTAANSILFLNSKGTIDFSADTGTITSGSIAGSTSSSIHLGSRTLTTGSLNTSTLFQGVIADGGNAGGTGGSLTKVGTGTLTLDHNNTYTGTTTVSGGVLQIGNGGSTGGIVSNVVDNASLVFDVGSAYTYSGIISGTGTVSKSGGSTFTLGGVDTYSGGTLLNAGVLIISADNNLGNSSGGLTFAGGTLRYGAGFASGRRVLLNSTGIFDTNGFNSTLSGIISGAGGLTKSGGTGTLILTGNETYSGATTVSAGTLQIGSGGTAGLITGNVTDNASLAFDRSDNQTFAGVISGSGALTQMASSTLTLTGANTYGGGTTISAGTVQIGNGAKAGAIAGNVVDNGALAFNLSSATTFGGVISGTGSLANLGAGTLTLTGANTFTGGTTISAGALQIGAGGTVGSLTGNIVDNGTLEFDRSDDFTFAGNISGTGSLIKAGTDTVTLTGNVSYTGTTTILGGALVIGTGGTTGSLVGDLVIDGTLTFNRADDYLYQDVISGTGSLTKLGAGTLTFTGTNLYTGGTTISAGALQLGNGGTTGSVVGNIVDNSSVLFNRADSPTFGGVISGTGSLANIGTGTLTLSGANTYTGGTTITSGTVILAGSNTGGGPTTIGTGGVLQIGNGTTAGMLAGNITDNGQLVFNRADNQLFAGSISGNGSLLDQGPATLTLSGNNTYAGNTTISAGTLVLTGSNTRSGTATIAPTSTLQIGNGGTTGGFAGNVVDNGVLEFDRSDNVTFGGSISGVGSLVQMGTGTLTLTGALSYTGTTTIDGGQLFIGSGGSVTGNLVINSALSFNRPDDYTYSSVLSGTGSVTQAGTGTLFFTGNNTYTGGTTISTGTLQLGNGGTTGSIVGNVIDTGELVFDRSDAVTFAGVISGTGNVTQMGTGVLTLTGANTFTGGTTVANGEIDVIGPTATLNGTSGITLATTSTANATLTVNSGGSVTTPGAVVIGQAGTGTLNLAGGATLTSGTIVLSSLAGSSSTVNIGLGGDPATINTATVTGGAGSTAQVVFNHDSPSYTFAPVLAGNLGVTQSGPGTTWLTGANTYTGGTFVNNGTLIGNATSLQGAITSATVVEFNQTSAGTYAGALTGTGQLVEQGAPLTLTGVSTYTGPTSISGTVNVDGGVLNGTSGIALGTLSSDNATLQLGNPLSSVRTSGSMVVGQVGTAALSIGNGALLTSADGTVGLGAGSNGNATVTGTGSLWSNVGTLTVGGSGTGTLTVSAGGLVSANNIRLGDAAGSSGTLNIGTGGASGIVNTATITGGQGATSTVNFNHSDASYTVATQLGGNLSVNQIGTGTTVLTANNTYTGLTTISGGTLQIGNGGTTGSIVGNIVDNGVLAFDRSDDFTIGGNISGTGSVVKMGAGTLTLTGSVTYTGVTTVLGGALLVGNGGTTGSWNGDLNIDSALTFDRSDDLVYGFVVSGTGSVTKLGTGTLTYTGTNTYTGGTTISVGNLQIGNGGTTGSIVGDVADNAGLTFNRSDNVSFAGSISGTGTLTQVGGDTLTLTGANTYSGGTVIASGTLQIGNGGTTGSITGNITDNGSLAFNRTDRSTFTGAVTGTGTLTQQGSGTLVMTGNNTFTGATSVAGTLQVSGGGRLEGTSGITLAPNASDTATLYVSGAGSRVTTPGSILVGAAGAGTLTIDNGATVTATGIILGSSGGPGGTLNVGTGGVSGAINAATVIEAGAAGSVVNLNYTDATYALAASLRNTLTLNQDGSGRTVLSGTNTYSGGTNLNAGVLQVSSNANLGASTGALGFNGGTLQLSATIANMPRPMTLNAAGGTLDTGAFSLVSTGTISGTGGLTKLGSGILTLDGTSSYTGGTTVSAGTLRGTTDSLQGGILNNGNVSFLQSTDGTYAGAMSGSGSLTKLDTGNLTLTGTNTYTGATTISSGTLTVNGSLISPVTVSTSGTLSGIGTLNGPVSVAGVLAPGNAATPFGTLTVNGNLTLAATSLLQVQTDIAGDNSRVNVTGASSTVSLNGGTVSVLSGGGQYATNTRYTVMTAGGAISGTFSTVSADFAFLTPSLSYDAHDVFLTLQRNDVPFAALAVGRIQKAAASYFQSLSDDAGSAPLIRGITNLTAPQATQAFNDLSGSSLADVSRVAMANTARLLEMLASRLGTTDDGAGTGLAFSTLTTGDPRAATSSAGSGSGFWMRQFAAESGGVDGGSTASENNSRGVHTAAGFDAVLSSRTVVGVSSAYTSDDVNVNDGKTRAAHIRTPQLLAYASRSTDSVQLRGVLGCGVHAYDAERAVTLGTATTELAARHDGTECSAYVQAEFGGGERSNGLRPLLGLLYSRLQEDRYAETGGVGALSIAGHTAESIVSNAGLRFTRSFGNQHGEFEARAIWNHEYGNASPALQASLAGAATPGSFLIPGESDTRDSAVVGVGVALQIGRNFTFHTDYDLELGGDRTGQQTLVAGLRYAY